MLQMKLTWPARNMWHPDSELSEASLALLRFVPLARPASLPTYVKSRWEIWSQDCYTVFILQANSAHLIVYL